ncbi:MAG TPA: hypothetical protein VID24_02735 [Candidatus Eremiobacteraceae bacterium]|jgi:hypothetical protein
MATVIVGGPHSGVGKTLACERALQALAPLRFGAIKLTVADGEFENAHDHGAAALRVANAAGICGRGASCGVCETVSTSMPSRIVTSRGAILKEGTDTWRLSQAGAIAVAWVITLRDAAADAIERAQRHLFDRGAEHVLIEGTTALDWIRPAASVMVAADPGRSWKKVALKRIASCDIVLRNALPEPCGDIPAPKALAGCDPIDCDLSSVDDPGTLEFQRRLARVYAALAV